MWIVRLTEQGCTYGPFTDRQVADGFCAFLAAEVDPATVEPAGPNPVAGLMDPVRELLAWREMHLDPARQVPLAGRDTTALAALTHVNGDSAAAAMTVAAWLADPNSDPELPGRVDGVLAHIADTAEQARALLALEAADLTRIRTIGDDLS